MEGREQNCAVELFYNYKLRFAQVSVTDMTIIWFTSFL